ncbi:MAG: DUF2723 domain-containing protein, partial [Candidatus Cloacimonetes bacterium]|nr:DUF2723 domain-containing protein [Candidatus Cloacimonadota bacterium]
MELKPKSYLLNKKINNVIALIVFMGSLLVYYLTLARSLSFWDAGEYITCSSTLGVPHPPGNPFYILLGRFLAIFSGNIPHAITINLLSAIFSAFAAMFTYLFAVKLISMWFERKDQAFLAYTGGFIAATFTAFSYTFWTNAIEAEVYSGLAFVINLIAWLTLVWVEKAEKLSHQNILMLIVYIFFLGFGIHQTSLQIAPAVLFVVLYSSLHKFYKTSKFWRNTGIYTVMGIVIYLVFNWIGAQIAVPDLAKYMIIFTMFFLLYYHLKNEIAPRTWLFAFFLILIGLSTHLFIYIRAAHRPFINEGNPHTIKLFTDYVLRRQYGPTSMFDRRATFLYQMKDQFLNYFSWQFFHVDTIAKWLNAPVKFIRIIVSLIVTFLGFGGAYYQYKRNKHSFAYLFSFFFMASIAMVFVINLSDTEVRVRDYFYVTAYNFWTVWMAIGSIALIAIIRKKSKALSYLMMIIVLSLPMANMASQYFIHDRSQEYIALDYGQNILNSVEENAIIFTNGDNDTFPVWYAQAVKDPAATEFIHPSLDTDSKGSATMRLYPTEKTKQLIETATNFKRENCYGIRKDVTIANLSLLNTAWYIQQLRDHEGVEFNIPNKHIETCSENRTSALYPRQIGRDAQVKISSPNPDDQFKVHIKAGTILYTKDLAVLQIIKDNYGKRPIYFAVTTPAAIGFENHLQNEGMVDRLVSSTAPNQFNIERLISNIDSVYSYRGIFDDKIYKDENMKRLLNNYGAAFMNASRYYHTTDDYSNAIKYLEKTLQFAPGNSGIRTALSKLYSEAGYILLEKGFTKEAFDHLENSIYYSRYEKSLIDVVVNAGLYSKDYDRTIE